MIIDTTHRTTPIVGSARRCQSCHERRSTEQFQELRPFAIVEIQLRRKVTRHSGQDKADMTPCNKRQFGRPDLNRKMEEAPRSRLYSGTYFISADVGRSIHC
jgi:hypothetical protein